ncbi:MAG TPA: pilus assembly protein PilM [Candidatus Hydrogenedentes bacterium]|nr:pilus assembly protein PilM [Candidatus Hydrogenedentota bacterium]
MFLSTKVAAIEFDGDTVRIVVVKVGGRLPVLLELYEATAAYDAPEQRFEALVNAVDAAVGQLRSHPAAFVLCASTTYSVVRTLRVGLKGRRRVAAAVPFELEPYLAFPIDDLLVDFTVVAERGGETEVLAVGSRRELLDEQLAILEAAGVEAEAVGLDAAGLTALWQAGRRWLKGLNAMLHVREHSAILAVTHNKSLVYFRHIAKTGDQVREEPTCVVREVQNTLRGFLAEWRAGGEITELHITGIEFEPDQRQRLEEALRMPVRDEVLLARLKGHEAAMDDEGYIAADNVWEAAIGVAVGAAGGRSAFDFKRFERDWRVAMRGVVAHAMFSACLALVAIVGWAYYCYQGTAKNEVLADELRRQTAEVNDEVAALRQQGLPNVPDHIMQLYRDPSLLDLLAELSEKMPGDEITIYEIRINQPGQSKTWITIRGEAPDVAILNAAFERLKQSSVMAIEREPSVRMGSTATFELNIQRKEGDGNA